MKKIIVFLLGLFLLFTSCVGSRTFITENPRTNEVKIETVERYGLLNQNQKQDDVLYQPSVGNIALSIVFGQTIVVPVVLMGFFLYKPVQKIQIPE